MIKVFFYIMTTEFAARIRQIKEDKDMLGAIILIILLFSVVKIGLKLAWSAFLALEGRPGLPATPYHSPSET